MGKWSGRLRMAAASRTPCRGMRAPQLAHENPRAVKVGPLH
jgi:hypothetical protein